MGSGRTVKFAVCEVLQFASLCVPLFIVMQRFAVIVAKVKRSARPPGDDDVAYWLIVTSSIAYVMSTALLVWAPLKYLLFVKNKMLLGRKKWRPIALVYVIMSTLPCFAFLIASSQVQINNGIKHDTFTELPVSLILFSLICIDVVERIRHCRLTGQDRPLERDADIPSSILTHVEQITPVTPLVPGPAAPGPNVPGPAVPRQAIGTPPVTVGPGQPGDRSQNGAALRPETNGTAPGMAVNGRRLLTVHDSEAAHTGPLRFLYASDARADVFVDSFLFWMDTVEMTRVATHPLVFYSAWVCPIYILCYLSCLRVVLVPHNPSLSSLGVALQDLPFLFVRVGLLAFFGLVTPLLYPMKNLLVCLAFVYFNFMTKLRVFNTQRMFL
ncbi:transmembrane protein 236-like [Nerophis lumbriciformis]|uniref:transmembrane protein 236-like n=1 Tax=Nerophis lumbriciformis TaxID=546530 RepID=UPI002ADF197B|nr:transmembrane protein 236-like [Nerophis lumbriciformis]